MKNEHNSNREGMETVRCPSVRGFKSHPPHQICTKVVFRVFIPKTNPFHQNKL